MGKGTTVCMDGRDGDGNHSGDGWGWNKFCGDGWDGDKYTSPCSSLPTISHMRNQYLNYSIISSRTVPINAKYTVK